MRTKILKHTKREFYRSKRDFSDSFHELTVKIEKRNPQNLSGIAQAFIHIFLYIGIFLFFFRDRLPMMGMFIAFMVATVAAQIVVKIATSAHLTKRFPFVAFSSEKALYKKYLSSVETRIEHHMEDYLRYNEKSSFSVTDLQNIVDEHTNLLWHRLPEHQDFITLYLGYGYFPFPVQLEFPTFHYSERDSILEKFRSRINVKIQNQAGSPNAKRMAFTFPLSVTKTLALIHSGLTREEFESILNALVLNLAVLQSYEELTLCFILNGSVHLRWVRFLPHTWRGNRRLIYDGSESQEEFAQLFQEALQDTRRQFVMFADVEYTQDKSIYHLLNQFSLPDNLHVIFFSQRKMIPSRTEYVLEYAKKNGLMEGAYQDKRFTADTADSDLCARIAKSLYNIRLLDSVKRVETKRSIPEFVTFFDLFQIRFARDLPLATEEENSMIQLQFPIIVGVGQNGEYVSLNLTNDYDGNHCIVTGTTGSGKSEFLLSFVLAACSRYSPKYFTFVAIDFKGGGMSSQIRNLPHCVGEFTNRGGDVTKREVTRIAQLLESEIEYRERILNEAGCPNDLSRYHTLYAEGKVKIPLPRLLILVDEVAVFFSKDETATRYITHIATVGRSLGMVLLLATQSKSGVIPAQVRTNINVSVEFYSEDETVKNGEKIKGRALIRSLLKDAVNCQTALVSAFEQGISLVDFISISGKSHFLRGTTDMAQSEQVSSEILGRYPPEDYRKDLHEVITEPLEIIMEEQGGRITLEKLRSDCGNAGVAQKMFPIGILDNIYHRVREPYFFSAQGGNSVIYGQQRMGKTTLIKTLLVSLFDKNCGLRPDEIAVYIISGNPQEFESYRFPHIGSILPQGEMYYLLLFLQKLITQRKAKGRNSYLPVLVIIDGCQDVIRQSEELIHMLSGILGESSSYGISVIFSTSGKPGFQNSFLNAFQRTIALYMGEDFDYSLLLHLNKIRKIPLVSHIGWKGETLEAQIAFPYRESELEIDAKASEYRELWNGEKPKPIPVMPKSVSLPPPNRPGLIPVGIARNLSVLSWDMEQTNTYLVSYTREQDAFPFLLYLSKVFAVARYEVLVMDNPRGSLLKLAARNGYEIRDNAAYFSCDEVYLNALQERLTELLEGSSARPTVLILCDYDRVLAPGRNVNKPLFEKIEQILTQSHNLFYGVFVEERDYMNQFRSLGITTKFQDRMEQAFSGMLIGSVPEKHTFGVEALNSYQEKTQPLNVGWGAHISPDSSKSGRVKIATEVTLL